MLRKLLKYDMRPIFNVWWIMSLSVIALSIVGAYSSRFLEMTSDRPANSFTAIAGLAVSGSVMAIFGSMLVVQILVYQRYHKHFFTDEGYLTFTLPVSRRMLFLSKSLNVVIWTVIHSVVMVVCGLIFMLIAPVPKPGEIFSFESFIGLGKIISSSWELCGAWFILYVIGILLLLIVSCFFVSGILFLCATAASLVVKKHRVLVAVCIYYLTNMAFTTAYVLFMMYCAPSLSYGMSRLMFGASSTDLEHLATLVILLIVCAACAALSCIINFISVGLLERKLNLS